jgi:hypothetical protein
MSGTAAAALMESLLDASEGPMLLGVVSDALPPAAMVQEGTVPNIYELPLTLHSCCVNLNGYNSVTML